MYVINGAELNTGVSNEYPKEKIAHKEQYYKKVSTEEKPDTFTKAEKPGVLKSFGKGLLFGLKQMVPGLSSHSTGKIENQHQAIVQELTNEDEFSINDSEKGKAATFGKGLLTKLAYCTPFYGTYKLGKEALENEYAYKTVIEGEDLGEYKKPGVLKSFGKGILKSIAISIPFLSTYTQGKDIEKQNQVYEELKAREAAADNE